mgnify:CR=1 FL=1
MKNTNKSSKHFIKNFPHKFFHKRNNRHSSKGKLSALCYKYQNDCASDGYLLCYLVLPLILVFLIECMAYHSLIGGFQFIIFHPYSYLINVMIISASFTFALVFRKRIGVIILLSLFWLTGGIINFVLLFFRVTPFTSSDLLLIRDGLDVATKYLNTFHYIAIGILIVVVITLFVLFFLKTSQAERKPKYIHSIPIILGALLLTWGGVLLGQSTGLLETAFRELSQSYLKNGFIYCFGASLLNTGISKPSDYSAEVMEQLTENYEVQTESEEGVTYYSHKPNIVIVQLESFFNVNRLKDVKFSSNPLPNLTKIMEEYPSGAFSMPVVGAGTVNSEFEVLTGMNIDDFGIGEYPYKTIVKETACESLAYNLKPYGYHAFAIHNNTGDFYDRNLVYPNLGFDTFTSVEYMWPDSYTPMDWAKDSILTEEIETALDSTNGQDFVFTVSVQGHGSYPSDSSVKYTHHVTVSSDTITDEAYMDQLNYYVNQLYEMDQFIGDLMDMLRNRHEPTILVMYGDHCPSLDLTDEKLTSGTIYDTEYFIWNNIGLTFDWQDMQAYEISSTILSALEIPDGAINAYHQNSGRQLKNGEITEEEYLSGLKELEYDVLYGDKITYGGENPYTPTNLQMGFFPITISDATYTKDHVLIIRGENFTRYSTVHVNGTSCDTLYLDPNTLVVANVDLSGRTEITVAQSTLSETDTYSFYPKTH